MNITTRFLKGPQAGQRFDNQAPRGAHLSPMTSVPVESVYVPERLIEVKQDVVNDLVQSIRHQGLMQPIGVVPERGKGQRLIFGRHRLEAFRVLQREDPERFQEIPVFTFDIPDECDRDAWLEKFEIEENLNRQDLTDAEKDLLKTRHAKVLHKLHGSLVSASLVSADEHQRDEHQRKDGRQKGQQHRPAFAKVLAELKEWGKTKTSDKLKQAREALGIPTPKQGAYTEEQEKQILDWLETQEKTVVKTEKKVAEKSKTYKSCMTRLDWIQSHWNRMSAEEQDALFDVMKDRFS